MPNRFSVSCMVMVRFIIIRSSVRFPRSSVSKAVMYCDRLFFPLVTRNAHPDFVPTLPHAVQRVTRAPFVHKAHFFVRANCARIETECPQYDAMQIQFLKRIAEQHTHSIGSKSFAPIVAVPDENPNITFSI